MMKKLVLPLIFLLGLAGCAPQQMRLVDTVDAPQFVAMSQAMRPAMLRKNLVDQRNNRTCPNFVSTLAGVEQVRKDLRTKPPVCGEKLIGEIAPNHLFAVGELGNLHIDNVITPAIGIIGFSAARENRS
jgi:hypothetical protein